jgi:hypothetical protein
MWKQWIGTAGIAAFAHVGMLGGASAHGRVCEASELGIRHAADDTVSVAQALRPSLLVHQTNVRLPDLVGVAVEQIAEAIEQGDPIPEITAIAVRRPSVGGSWTDRLAAHDVFLVRAPDRRVQAAPSFELLHFQAEGLPSAADAIKSERLLEAHRFLWSDGRLTLLDAAMLPD